MAMLPMLSVMMAACGSGSAEIDRSVVSDFSLGDFMGRWYEIARFDHSFERGMEYVTADYSLLGDGTVEVLNSGMRDGEPHTAKGRAKTTDTPVACACRSSGSSTPTTTCWRWAPTANGPLWAAARRSICGYSRARRNSGPMC